MTRRNPGKLAARLGLPERELGEYVPRYNVAPMQPYFVLTTSRDGQKAIPAIWGLVNSWAIDDSRAYKCINAKAESIERSPTFRGAFYQRRCVVPADGFYEWRGLKRKREPLYIRPADKGLLLFAGLYEALAVPDRRAAEDFHHNHDFRKLVTRANT
jgi:putative SOS response-associated peptidase YedK